jgi:hypothetical protein
MEVNIKLKVDGSGRSVMPLIPEFGEGEFFWGGRGKGDRSEKFPRCRSLIRLQRSSRHPVCDKEVFSHLKQEVDRHPAGFAGQFAVIWIYAIRQKNSRPKAY